jgi:ATP synthase subunit 6
MTILLFNFFFSYNTFNSDKKYLRFLIIFIKLCKNTLKTGFKISHLPILPSIILSFILFYLTNFLSLFPFTNSFTTSLPIVFIFVLITQGTLNLIGIYINKMKFLTIFFPAGVPAVIGFLLIPVELIAYFARFVSLTVRIFANLLSGYILMEMLFTFFFVILQPNFLIETLLITIVIILISALKISLSVLQAYIFSTLLSFYLNDPIFLH